MKKRLCAAALLLVIVFSAVTVGADRPGQDIAVVFNGTALEFDVQPVVVDGQVFMPIEAFGQLGFDFFRNDGWFIFNPVTGEPLSEGRHAHMAQLNIDYVQIIAGEGFYAVTLDHLAHLTFGGAMALGIEPEWFDPNGHILGLAFSVFDLHTSPFVIARETNFVFEPEEDEDGFVEIPRMGPANTLMLPVNPIVSAAGFLSHWDESTKTLTLTRSDNPEFERDNQMMSLFELAEIAPFPIRLFWNATERILEARD